MKTKSQTEKTPRQITIENNRVMKELRTIILTCCSNAWAIPTDEIKLQILKSELSDIEIQNELDFVKEMTEEDDDKVVLNTILTRFFYINEICSNGMAEEYNELTHDAMCDFLFA
jgi:hypothetical protein